MARNITYCSSTKTIEVDFYPTDMYLIYNILDIINNIETKANQLGDPLEGPPNPWTSKVQTLYENPIFFCTIETNL